MLSGIENKGSGSELKMFINQPANDTCLYDLSNPARQNSFNTGISKAYPAEVAAYRADTTFPLRLWGETVPLATVNFYVNSMTTVKDTRSADASGNFDHQSPAVTSALNEGENTIYAQATKGTYYSPYAPRRVILDLNTPVISGTTPSGTVGEFMPYVGAVLQDTAASTGIPCGICQEVIALKVNGAEVQYIYDQASGRISWKDTATNMPALLVNGNSYTVVLEGGDNAYYKVNSTWTFTVAVSEPDNSEPAVANKIPLGSNTDFLPEIGCRVFDNQSGIDPYSIALKFDGAVVVSSANIASHWDAETGTVSYTPPAALSPGSYHTCEITVSHWANTPANKKTRVESWDFTVKF
ncbi:MAG: hypothetical protein A2X34_06635 [Elusimicrobia bacterium GWC2_51_8]|nr:MAG: hypothetical protein A2X34_06635 [Elusimicrobia bacterium GWC2_51_8]